MKTKIEATAVLKELLAGLAADGNMFHLDDDPAEFDCFTTEEAEAIGNKLSTIRDVLTEDELWDIAAEYM